MEMNLRETWTVVHGMVFGFIFLMGFSGALYMVYSMKQHETSIVDYRRHAQDRQQRQSIPVGPGDLGLGCSVYGRMDCLSLVSRDAP
jgi:hypothetical protein